MDIDSHHSKDKVFKESLELYRGQTLDFLDAELDYPIIEILSTEITETRTKKAYADTAFKLADSTGLASEWEHRVEEDDLMRFGGVQP